MKLQQRGMQVDTRCPVCFRLDEDGGHCFIKCKRVKDVWRKAQLEHVRLQILDCTDALGCMEKILNLNEEEKIKSCLLLWRWWHERNRANAGNEIKPSDEICHSINYLFMQFSKVRQEGRIQEQQQKERWSRPPPKILKINTDGAYLKESNSGGWGFVIRNDCGMVIAAGAGNLGQVSDALHSEAMAMLHAINAAIQMGCHCVIMETDSVQLQSAVNNEDYDLSTLGAIFKDIKFKLRVSFNHVTVVSCPRTCNVVAHCLAAYGTKLGAGISEIWLDECPDFVNDAVAGNLSSPCT